MLSPSERFSTPDGFIAGRVSSSSSMSLILVSLGACGGMETGECSVTDFKSPIVESLAFKHDCLAIPLSESLFFQFHLFCRLIVAAIFPEYKSFSLAQGRSSVSQQLERSFRNKRACWRRRLSSRLAKQFQSMS